LLFFTYFLDEGIEKCNRQRGQVQFSNQIGIYKIKSQTNLAYSYFFLKAYKNATHKEIKCSNQIGKQIYLFKNKFGLQTYHIVYCLVCFSCIHYLSFSLKNMLFLLILIHSFFLRFCSMLYSNASLLVLDAAPFNVALIVV
jgi:hypothetical protein